MDGITIGYSRCSASKEQLVSDDPSNPDPPPCTNTLLKVKDRYCPEHAEKFKHMCPCQPCTRPVAKNSATCDAEDHQQAFKLHKEKKSRGQGTLSLIQRPGARLPVDPTASLDAETGDIVDYDALVDTDQTDRVHEAGRDGNEGPVDNSGNGSTLGTKPRVNRITVSHARTHNDMLFVTCCGLIVCRETQYRAESPKLVKVMCLFSKNYAASSTVILNFRVLYFDL